MASRFLRHRWLKASGGLAGLALVGMLGAPTGAALAQEVCPQRGGTIKTVDMNYADMDPTAQIDPHSYLPMVYDSLIDVTTDLEYRPGLAEELPEQVGDASYVFKLREGVTFHDGTPFDAEAVKHNVDRIVAGDVITPHTGLWREWLDAVTVVDPQTVRFDLKRPWPDFYWGVASTLFFASPTALAQHGESYGTSAESTAGTGPFIMTAFAPKERIELERNPDYYRAGEPCVDGVVGTLISSGSVRLLGLQRGDLTNVYTFPESQLPLIEGADGIVIEEGEATTLTVLVVNTKHPALNDRRVRQAIQLAVDGQEIIDKVYRGRGQMIDGLFPPWHEGHVKATDLSPIRPDPDKAKALLAEAGYGPDNPLRITLETYAAPAHVERSVLLQAQLKQVGIETEVRNIPSGQAQQNMLTGNFALSLWQMNGGPALIDYTWDLLSGESGKNNSNYNKPGGYQNPEVEPLLTTIAHAPNPEAVQEEIATLQEIVFQDVPYIYLNWRNHRDAWREELKSFKISKLKNFQDFRTVWIEQ
jgi:glutathione transport system substrate-binding protein